MESSWADRSSSCYISYIGENGGIMKLTKAQEKKSAIKLNRFWKEIKAKGSKRVFVMKDKYWEMLYGKIK